MANIIHTSIIHTSLGAKNSPRTLSVNIVEGIPLPVISSDYGGTVTITSIAGATIYYTTDGGTPTTASSEYTEPFSAENGDTIKAFATKEGMRDSQVAEYVVIGRFIFVEGGTVAGITVSDFYLDKYELTQADVDVMGSNPSSWKADTLPVERVSWFNAIEYCNRRSLQEGLTPCYSYSTFGTSPDNWPSGWNTSSTNHVNVSCDFSAIGYRLPRESEWEYAARGGLQTHGYTYSGSNNSDEVAWYSSNSGSKTHSVGGKLANELGLYDMSGNAMEWCWDIYSGYNRVFRGGSWSNSDGRCTVSYRGTGNAAYGGNWLGFRVCRSSPVMPENFVFVEGGTIRTNLTVDDFYIDKYELTQAEYVDVMGSNPSNWKADTLPVEMVSWFNAIEYCNRRSIKEGLTPCYSYSTYGTNPADWPSGWNTSSTNHVNVSCDFSAIGYRLPRESEWEYAARGGLQTHGYTYSGSNNIDEVAWYSSNSGSKTHSVGGKLANELGLYDMSGNAMEWCWDIYSGHYRVVRGGSWSADADGCTVSGRGDNDATYGFNFLGFRVCRSSP